MATLSLRAGSHWQDSDSVQPHLLIGQIAVGQIKIDCGHTYSQGMKLFIIIISYITMMTLTHRAGSHWPDQDLLLPHYGPNSAGSEPWLCNRLFSLIQLAQ